MVSADNLNLDVLELIFAYVSGNDLVSVALVSRSFFAGVIPRLYHTLLFRMSQAKRYPSVLSPFASILAHPDLAVHVKNVDIRTIPVLKTKPHPKFLRDTTSALDICRNISSFVCTVDALPSFILSLHHKERLQDIRVKACITDALSEKLIDLRGLRNVTLDFPSWHILDRLPKWASSLQRTLTSLTLHMSTELNDTVLESTLAQLPKLTGLHIIGSPKVDHVALLYLLKHTPLLESLSFSTWATQESSRSLTAPFPYLGNLRHLSLDIRTVLPSSPSPTVLNSILTCLRSSSPSLLSFSISLADHETSIPEGFVQRLLLDHGHTLTRVAFMNCNVGLESVKTVCTKSTALENLEVAVPVKDLVAFTKALSCSKTLHTLIDIGDPHITHTTRLSLSGDNVRYMMDTAENLTKIVSDNRVWTGVRCPYHGLALSLHKRKVLTSTHWFMPRA